MNKITRLLSVAIIAMIAVCGYAYADAITLHWSTPVTNGDGTSIVDLASFNVYARADTNFVQGADIIANLSQGVVSSPVAGQVYEIGLDIAEGSWVTVTSVDSSDNESAFAQAVQYVDGAVLDIPNAPDTLFITKP